MDIQNVSVAKLGYSYAEAELVTGLSRSSIYRAVKRGDLRSMKVGNRVIIPVGDLAKLCGTSEVTNIQLDACSVEVSQPLKDRPDVILITTSDGPTHSHRRWPLG